MARVNLLPWREQRRRERRQQFFSVAAATLIVGLAVVGGVHLYFESLITYQNSRNQFLQVQITSLDKKIQEIKDLEKERDRLLSRMQAIEKLRTVRPVIVHLFDAIVESLPKGVYLSELQQVGTTLTLKGVSSSNAWVSNFMRNIEKAKWLTNPRLDVIQTTLQDGRRVSNFTLKLEQVAKKDEESEEESS